MRPELVHTGPEEDNRNTSGAGDVLTEEEAKIDRARNYRRLYKERQKEKEKLAQQKLEDTQRELEELRSENASLITQTTALSLLASYSNSMIEALSATAAASAAKARSIGSQAIETMHSFRGWFLVMPTIPELLAGMSYSPSDAQLSWILKLKSPKDFYAQHMAFIDRLALILEEGKKSPEAQKHAELKIDYLLCTAVRFNRVMHKERPKMLEEIVCIHQLKALRGQVAAGKYVRPRILQSDPTKLTGCISLSPDQILTLKEHWDKFVKDIQSARSILGKYTSKVEASTEATMETGVYNPSSCKAAAEHFLLATDVANASDEFLLREGQAFIRLYIGAIETLTPIQTAKILTSCRPLVPHLPEVLASLLR